jgi:hypothetical protein
MTHLGSGVCVAAPMTSFIFALIAILIPPRSPMYRHSFNRAGISHTAMGIAVGLAFAFLATHITALGIATLINYGPTPDVVMREAEVLFDERERAAFAWAETVASVAEAAIPEVDINPHVPYLARRSWSIRRSLLVL